MIHYNLLGVDFWMHRNTWRFRFIRDHDDLQWPVEFLSLNNDNTDRSLFSIYNSGTLQICLAVRSELNGEGLSCSVWWPNCIQFYPPVYAVCDHFTWLHFFIQIIHQASIWVYFFPALLLFDTFGVLWWDFNRRKMWFFFFPSCGTLLLKHLKSQVWGGASRTDRHAWPI